MTRRVLVALVAGATVLAPACGGDPAPAASDAAEPSDAAVAPEASEACGEVERPTLQSGGHLIGDAEPPVPYSSNPPTSGWHRSGALRVGVQVDPLSGPELVSALESGHVVVAYDPATVDAAEVDRLEQLATGALPDRVTTTPWAPMPTPIALVGWGALQRCQQLDVDVVTAFTLTWFGEASRHE